MAFSCGALPILSAGTSRPSDASNIGSPLLSQRAESFVCGLVFKVAIGELIRAQQAFESALQRVQRIQAHFKRGDGEEERKIRQSLQAILMALMTLDCPLGVPKSCLTLCQSGF